MGFWRGAVLAAAWLCAGAAGATEGAREDAADAVAWPLPWAKATTLVYDDRYEKVVRRGGAETTVRGQGVTHVSTTPAADGYRQRWWSENLEFDAAQLGGMAPVMAAAVKALEGVPIEFQLDAAGAYVSLTNVENVAGRYRSALKSMFAGIDAEIPAEAKAEAADILAMLDRLADTLTSPEVLSVTLAEAPAAYNAVAGGGLAPGREYRFADEGRSPLSDRPLPRSNLMTLAAAPDAPGRYDVRWVIELEPEALHAQLAESFDRLTAGTETGMEGAALFSGARIATTIDYRVDAASGRVERMQRTKVQRFGDQDETETSVMTLRRPAPAT